ncbi:MAG: helix-turn-helix domain-containing protein [Planctomycetes bacterium]|nr:helix-turn-helix domain-containing protein [Planctomycetota bacterium]
MPESVATPLLLDIGDTAAFLGFARRSLERYQSAGKIGPEPVRIGTRKMYRSAELAEWVGLGCPNRQSYQAMRAAKGDVQT